MRHRTGVVGAAPLDLHVPSSDLRLGCRNERFGPESEK